MGEAEHGRRGKAVRSALNRALAATIALGVAGCSAEAEIQGDEPVDYAAINEAAEGPAVAIALQPIKSADLEPIQRSGAVCLVLDEQTGAILIAAHDEAAHLMLDGELKTLSPHSGSNPLRAGIVSEFDGRTHSLTITPDRTGDAGPDRGTILIRDAKGRVVLDRSLPLECDA